MADNKSSSGKNSGKNVSANISGKTEISVTNNVVNNNSSKVNTSSASASAVSSKESKESNRVDTGETSSLTRRELKQFSDTLSEVLSNNKSKDNYNEFESLIKSLKENNELFNNAMSSLTSAMTKKNDESSNPNKTEKTPEERDAEKAQKATDAAVAALIELDESLNNKTSVLSDTAKAAARAAGSSLKEGNAHKAMAVSALSAINPMLGTVTQMLLSDTVGKYTSKFFGSMFAFGQSKVAQAQRETELRDKVIEALNKSAVNVEELMEKTAELKNIDVQKLLEAKRNANIPEEFGGKKKSTQSDAAKEGITANDIKESTIKQEGLLSSISTGIGSLASAIMPKKKTGAEEAHAESEKKDLFGRIKSTVGKGVSKGASMISSLFSAIKKAFISSLGLLALYFSSDQFKAWLKGWITAPFKRIGDEISNWWNGEQSFGDMLKGIFGNLGSVTKVAAGVLLGLKLIFGKFFPLGSILKLGAVGVVKALKGGFSIAKSAFNWALNSLGFGNEESEDILDLDAGSNKKKTKAKKGKTQRTRAKGRKLPKRGADGRFIKGGKGKLGIFKKGLSSLKNLKSVSSLKAALPAAKGLAKGATGLAKGLGVGFETFMALGNGAAIANEAIKSGRGSELGDMLLSDVASSAKENYQAIMEGNAMDKVGGAFGLFGDAFKGMLAAGGKLGQEIGKAAGGSSWVQEGISWFTGYKKPETLQEKMKKMTDDQLKDKIAFCQSNNLPADMYIAELNARKGGYGHKDIISETSPIEPAKQIEINNSVQTAEMISSEISKKKDQNSIKEDYTISDLVQRLDLLISVVEKQRTAIVNNSNISSTLAFSGR